MSEPADGDSAGSTPKSESVNREPLGGTPHGSLDVDRELFGRVVWLIFAALSWKYALHIEAYGLPRDSAAAVFLYVSGYGLGIFALVMSASSRASFRFRDAYAFAFFAFFVASYAVADALMRSRTQYNWLTDAHAYMDSAARILLRGRDPYSESLYGAYSLHRLPSELQTPLRDGGLSDRLAYPSLSFLILVPFVALGVDSRLVYALAMLGSVALLYSKAPRSLRPLVLIPFVANQDFLEFCLGGVTDSIWAFFLCVTVVTWEKRYAPAIFYGLACACKQHAWMLAPLVAVRLYREAPPDTRLRDLARFFGIAGAIILVFNLPFIVWQPGDWLRGIVESLVGDMVPFGAGPSAFVFQTGVALPKWAFAVVFWTAYFGLVVLCARTPRYRNLIWIAPSIAFFFNYRSLSSYWFFNFFPFAIDVVMRPPLNVTLAPIRTKRALVVALVASALVAGGFAFARAHDHDLDVEIVTPIRTWNERAIRLDVKLTNRTRHAVAPRFWVHGQNFQPLPWRIDSGPWDVPPGGTASYSISSLHRSSEFDGIQGARITVTDDNSDVRVSTVIATDKTLSAPYAIPNADFRYWDINNGVPTFWFVTEEGSAGAFASNNEERPGVVLNLDPDERTAEKRKLQFCAVIPTCFAATTAGPRTRQTDATASDHAMHVVVDTAFFPGRVRVWAYPPEEANRAPGFDERYGVVVSIGPETVFVLLGGEPGEGRLTDGTRYLVVPGARARWSNFEIDLGALKDKFAPLVYPGAYRLERLPLLNVPLTSLRLSLTYASRTKTRGRAMFGTIDDDLPVHERPEAVMEALESHRGQVDAYRAEYEMSLRNPSRGLSYMSRANRVESHPILALKAAQLALQHGEPEIARDRFSTLLDQMPVEAHLGRGWAELGLKSFPASRADFEAALIVLSDLERTRHQMTGEEELQRLNGTVGLAITYAVESDCPKATATLVNVPDADLRQIQTIPELVPCFADGGAR